MSNQESYVYKVGFFILLQSCLTSVEIKSAQASVLLIFQKVVSSKTQLKTYKLQPMFGLRSFGLNISVITSPD